jgi:hypothetical protein
MNIEIHIERLVLEGIDIPHADRPALQAAIATELARLMAEGGIGEGLRGGGAVPSLAARPIAIAPGGAPAQIGTSIARSVYGELGR